MSRTWKMMEISVLAAALAAAVAIVGAASAQEYEGGRDDNQESTAESNREESRDDEDRNGQATREQDDREARDTQRDEDSRRESRSERDQDAIDRSDVSERGEFRSRITTRDEFRRAPDTMRRQSVGFDSRQSDEFGRSDEQGGLGVSVIDDEQEGVRVVRVYRSTPAEEMGLRSGDRITHVDGREIGSARDFIARIRSMEPGEEVDLDIIRNRDERSLTGELESRAEALPARDQQSWQGGQIVYGGGGDALNRIYAIERQLEQLRQELQQLKSSLELRQDGGYNQTTGRESPVIYYENQPQSGESRFSTRQSQFESQPWQGGDVQRGPRLGRPNEDRSPGGETGEDRLRPSAQQLNER